MQGTARQPDKRLLFRNVPSFGERITDEDNLRLAQISRVAESLEVRLESDDAGVRISTVGLHRQIAA